MNGCCGASLESQFDAKRADGQLAHFRRKGAPKETRLLVDALLEQSVAGASVLDIGSGIGALQEALLRQGVSRAVSVDASSSYLRAAETLAQERGYRERVDYIHGDFVDVADSVPAADVVTLDKVICCYPDMLPLVGKSADRAGRLFGAIYPRDNLPMRTVTRLQNARRRIARNDFRTYVHPERAITRLLLERGFELRSTARTLVWKVVVYARS